MYSALIIDDEKPARTRVQKLLKNFSSKISTINEAGNYDEAVSFLSDHDPDIIFLDIQLKNKTGFDVLEAVNISQKSVLIFTTAYDQHAVKAFEYFAYDYLLKPFKDERFHKSVKRTLKKISSESTTNIDQKIDEIISYIKNLYPEGEGNYLSTIPVRLNNKTYFLNVSKIKYIKADGYYAELVVGRKKHIIRESLKNLEQQLDPNTFIRIHRSTIINQHFIDELIRVGYGDYELKMKDGKQFRVSKSYKQDLSDRLGV